MKPERDRQKAYRNKSGRKIVSINMDSETYEAWQAQVKKSGGSLPAIKNLLSMARGFHDDSPHVYGPEITK